MLATRVSLGDAEVPIDLDRKTSGQGGGTERRLAAAARFPRDLDHEIGGPIDHCGVVCEVFARIDETANAQTGDDAFQVAVQGNARSCAIMFNAQRRAA
jgi:hypothetical protein